VRFLDDEQQFQPASQPIKHLTSLEDKLVEEEMNEEEVEETTFGVIPSPIR
jgi:hypothetical protein